MCNVLIFSSQLYEFSEVQRQEVFLVFEWWHSNLSFPSEFVYYTFFQFLFSVFGPIIVNPKNVPLLPCGMDLFNCGAFLRLWVNLAEKMYCKFNIIHFFRIHFSFTYQSFRLDKWWCHTNLKLIILYFLYLFSFQVCDGVIDCPDMSDECLCQVTSSPDVEAICQSVCWAHAHSQLTEAAASKCKCHPGELLVTELTDDEKVTDDVITTTTTGGECVPLTSLCTAEEKDYRGSSEAARVCALTKQVRFEEGRVIFSLDWWHCAEINAKKKIRYKIVGCGLSYLIRETNELNELKGFN